MTNTMMQAALQYAKQGLAVFPVQAGGKKPLTSNGFQAASTDEGEIRSWWTRWPNANIGIATGRVSGVYVLDVDEGPGKEGMISFAALEEKVGPIPRSNVVRTGSGGLHIYLAMPAVGDVKSRAGKLGPNLDSRGDGGYVVAPPSVHANGQIYAWETGLTSEFEACPALVKEIGSAKRTVKAKVGGFMRPGSRNDDLCSVAGGIHRRGASEEQLVAALLATNAKATDPLSEEEVERIARSIAKYPTGGLPEKPDDTFLAGWIAERIKGDFRVVGSTWWSWKAPVWVRDDSRNEIQERVKDELNAYRALVPEAPGLGARNRVKAVLELMRSERTLQSNLDEFNADTNLINLANGVYRLDTQELLPHDSAFRLTKFSPVEYDREASAPQFEKFLEHIQPDPEVRRFLARLFGYILTGSLSEQKFCFFHGKGANGKSVLIQAIAKVFGGYADNADPSTFIRQKVEKIRGDLVRLEGARLVKTDELALGQVLDAALVKRFTGGDAITARALYANDIVFSPTATVVMTTNALPVIDGGDHALARRLIVVPFGTTISSDQMDHRLNAKLWAEASGILRWILEGLEDYHKNGLVVPSTIAAASREFVRRSDLIQDFVDEHCNIDPAGRLPAGETYTQYRLFCFQQGVRPLSRPTFKPEMEKRYGEQKKINGCHYYPGLSPRCAIGFGAQKI